MGTLHMSASRVYSLQYLGKMGTDGEATFYRRIFTAAASFRASCPKLAGGISGVLSMVLGHGRGY